MSTSTSVAVSAGGGPDIAPSVAVGGSDAASAFDVGSGVAGGGGVGVSQAMQEESRVYAAMTRFQNMEIAIFTCLSQETDGRALKATVPQNEDLPQHLLQAIHFNMLRPSQELVFSVRSEWWV